MIGLLRLVVHLYPAAWRKRYGRELEALLEDAAPGWRGLFDLLEGALTMRMQTLGTIPVACALAGAAAGGIIALRTPTLFASSATIRLTPDEAAKAESRAVHDLRGSLVRALDGGSTGARGQTEVMVLRNSADQTLQLTYLDRDPSRAQRVAERLTTAIVEHTKGPAGSAEVLDRPRLPRSPVDPDYSTPVASGSGIGLLVGGLVFLVMRSRQRPARVG